MGLQNGQTPLGDTYNVRMFGRISYFELIWIVVAGRKEECQHIDEPVCTELVKNFTAFSAVIW